MVHRNIFSKMGFLALTVCATTQPQTDYALYATQVKRSVRAITSSTGSCFGNPKVWALTAVSMWIYLQTKPKCEYDFDWQNDYNLLVASYNIFDIQSCKNIAYLLNKYVIGSPEKTVDEFRTEVLEDGTIVKVSGKKKISLAFGALGLFDKYVINMLEKLGNISSNWEKTNKLFEQLEGKPVSK